LPSGDVGRRRCWRGARRFRAECPGATAELSTARGFAGVAGAWAGELADLAAALRARLHDRRERGQVLTTLPENGDRVAPARRRGSATGAG
jgi:hypothetical protein